MGKNQSMRTSQRDTDRDVGAVVLRMTLGPMLIAHGANKVLGKGGLEGTTGWFSSLGLRPAWLHARLAAATEIGSGALITVGALAPLPEAAAIGLMATAAATDHRGKGFFVFKGGWEYVAVVGGAATALATLGHGPWSIDSVLGRGRRGPCAAASAVGLGLVNAALLLAACYRPKSDDRRSS